MNTQYQRMRSFRRDFSYLAGPMLWYRLGHFLYRVKLSPLAEICRYLGIFLFHCDISYKAKLGARVSFPHYGLGAVIGKYATLGDECVVMPGALIGATLRNQNMPTLGRAVVVGAGAKILGDVTIGDGAVIAANAVVVENIPADTLVGGIPARVLKHNLSTEALEV